ncbi:hypothetical protein C9E81_16710 [Paracoccus alkanivorans]|uniref:RHS protein conserved region domain-containing protein n=1 Tax=Paracoccus alkanivorans TaxID=2116655 RepID=A0A3M0M719_9RHOB|nr:hypothetical protein C9E81_16710 [Paracoccus alkanivorans]
MRRVLTSESEEFFEFDPANTILVDVRNVRDASVQGGRVLMRGDCHYEYDNAGNRVRLRRGQGGAHIFRYVYDDMNNLIEVREERGRTRRITRFAYDALTRRVSKAHREIMEAANSPLTPDREDSEELVRDETTWFLWNGDALLAEGRSSGTGTFDPLALVYVYEPDSFRPAAQILRHSADAESKILLYWLDHIGTPQELSNENGELVWQVALKAWGKTARVFVGRVSQNLRFQGQYYDEETGLHYNRFRHYDPSSGIFLSQDPITLLGGERPFSYPTNPMNQVDPLGLIDPGDTNGGKGYVVYQLVDRKTGDVKYVGITEADRYEQRMAEHRRSGRYHGGLRDGTITNTSTYGAARGAEQYHIEHANNGKGTLSLDSRGKPLGKGTEGNRARSYDPARTDLRATAYKNEYDNERRRVTSIGLGCN